MKTYPSEKRFERLVAQYGETCHYCGETLTRFTFTRDHIVPRSKGGSNKRRNKVAACQKCNHEKGNRLPDGHPNKYPPPDIKLRMNTLLRLEREKLDND